MSSIKRLFGDKFIKNNIVFFCGSMVVAFLNYLYYPVLGRVMKVADFGELQAFISFALLFGAFSGIFQNVIVNIVSNRRDERDQETVIMLQRAGLYFSLFIALILIVFGGRFAQFFNLKAGQLLLALAVSIGLNISLAARQAVVQGLHDFKTLSVSNIIYSGGRIIFSFGLVYLGFNVLGAAGGLVLAQAAALVYVGFYLRQNFKLDRNTNVKIDGRINKELAYAFLFFAAALSTTFMYSGDTIVVKKFFSPEMAGLYGGIATVGRIVFFVSGSVAAVLFPFIKRHDENNENKKILVKAAALVVLIGGAVLLIFTVFPSMVVNILIGSRYVQFASLLPEVALFLFFVSLANLLFFYLLALRDRFVFFAAAAAPIITIVLCLLYHRSVGMIVTDFTAGSAATLVLLLARTSFEFRGKRQYEPVNLGSDTVVQ